MTDDREAVLAKYAAKRAKRLRPDGNDQYVRPAGEFAHYLGDPWRASGTFEGLDFR